jgi:hypothetical protein
VSLVSRRLFGCIDFELCLLLVVSLCSYWRGGGGLFLIKSFRL